MWTPFALKTVDIRFELFPAVIFPSGSSRFDINDEISFNIVELEGVRNSDLATQKLDYVYFFKHLKVHYFPQLLRTDFGLAAFTERETLTNKLGIPFKERSRVTQQEIENTKLWLRKGLQEQGFADSVLVIKNKKLTINRDTKELTSNIETSEKRIALY